MVKIETIAQIEKMPMEEKFKLLSVADKAIIRRVVELAVGEQEGNGSLERSMVQTSEIN
ncbi:MAG: hypothetical protein LBI03_08625 [Clostridiales bacterium]|jgi:hypothetical protein|nr:hypothetical protein [Clostridiales bacterium]